MAIFTDAQIEEIMRIMMQNFGVHQYIGSRYVPIFGRKDEDDWTWDNNGPYEPLTIVQYQGVSYTSKQYVPAGLGSPDNNPDFWAETGNWNAQIEAYRQEVLTFDGRITDNANDIDSLEDEIDTIKSNNWVTTNRIANSAVTSSKLADNAVTETKVTKNAVIQYLTTGIIFIGDSYISGSSNGQWVPTFPDYIGNALNVPIETYAVAGIGWGRSVQNRTMYDLCVDAAENSNFKNYRETIIIIYGGVNDVTSSQNTTTVQTNITRGIAALNSGFANPRIIVCGINLGKSNFANQPGYFPYFRAWKNASIQAGGNVTFYDSRGWLASDNTSYAQDELHPVGSHGNDILKNKFLSLIMGAETKFTAISDEFTLVQQTIQTNTWIEQAIIQGGTMECTEGVYTLKFNYNDFTDFTNNISSATSENIYRSYAHGQITCDNLFNLNVSGASRLMHHFEPFFRTSQTLCFYPEIVALANKMFTWIKLISPNKTEAAIASGSYIVANESWSIL